MPYCVARVVQRARAAYGFRCRQRPKKLAVHGSSKMVLTIINNNAPQIKNSAFASYFPTYSSNTWLEKKMCQSQEKIKSFQLPLRRLKKKLHP